MKEVDMIAAEDTRNSIKLLNHFEIKTPMTSYHEYNKIEKGHKLVQMLLEGKNLAPKIELIQNAVEERNLLTFQYYAPKGNSKRRIEPYYLVFKWSSWYVWGWCTEKKDFRLFYRIYII